MLNENTKWIIKLVLTKRYLNHTLLTIKANWSNLKGGTMDEGIVINKSVIRESEDGDLIIAINCHFHKWEGEKIHPGKIDIPLMDLRDLPHCEEGFDCFQIPGSEDLICACKIDNGKIRTDSTGWETIRELH